MYIPTRESVMLSRSEDTVLFVKRQFCLSEILL